MVENTDEIWGKFSDRIRRFVLRHVRDYHDGEDILQDIFLKIHNNIGSLNDRTKIEAWVYRIARNTVVDYYRQQKTLTVDPAVITQGSMDMAMSEGDAGSPISCIRPMIENLPEKYRLAIIMTENEGLTQKEMAEKLGLSISGAKSRVQRAREMLKKMLLECCHFEFDRLGNILDYRHKLNCCPFCDSEKNGC